MIDMGSGLLLAVYPADAYSNGLCGGGQAFGEADAANFGALQNSINMCGSNAFGSSRHNNPAPSSLFPDMGSTGYGPSFFADPRRRICASEIRFLESTMVTTAPQDSCAVSLSGTSIWV